MKKTDILFINPGGRTKVFQKLGSELSAIEPPYWTALIAEFIRRKEISVDILDANALNYGSDEINKYIKKCTPTLIVFIVYGQQPSASTQSMTAVGEICKAIKSSSPQQKILIGGPHASALPGKTLKEEATDFVCEGEGPYTLLELLNLLKSGNDSALSKVPGLWYRENGQIKNNPPAPLIKNLDDVLPVAAWDLLPMKEYRAHNWHCFHHINERKPYASIYTSFGCPFNCVFCCIQAPFGKPGIRFRSPENVVKEIGLLVDKYQIKNLKIIDEMFVLKESHVLEICDLIIEKGYDLNIWAYSRIDTIHQGMLQKLKKAGFLWLALGIESGSKYVRDGVEKSFGVKEIKETVAMIHEAGIEIVANFIFGLPDDDLNSMQETLDLAVELNCAWANLYSTMAYPGSKLYQMAIEKGVRLPDTWVGYSQYAYETLPLPTDHLSASEVLEFRDKAFTAYYTNPDYLSSIKEKFGEEALKHIQEMTVSSLERKYV